MCGFVGYTGKIANQKGVLDTMSSQIAHRGPDSTDSYIDEDVALGFRRLAIIDLEGGSQPIFNEDKTKVLVFNGEIYNYKPLQQELKNKGHIFTTNTDSEVLIHGYEEWGSELLSKLRGMFAFAIWDTRNKKLFIARDFFGIKPLYYTLQNNTFIFGSEIKSFLPHPHFKKELREELLPTFLTFGCIPSPDSFFKDVYKLPPGHFLEYQNGKLNIQRYFTPIFKNNNEKGMDDFVSDIRKVFSESVAAHKISDVEVGCFLSSGVDSSYVTKELSTQQRLKTYTAGFDHPKYDEAKHAQEFAKEINVENKTVIIPAQEYFDAFNKVQYHMDEPLANPSAVGLYFVSQLAAKDVKVVLSGEGADEMFGGYNIYKEPIEMAWYRKLPLFIRKTLGTLVSPLPNFKGKSFFIRGAGGVQDWYVGNSSIFDEKQRTKILKNAYPHIPILSYVTPLYNEVKDQEDVTKMQYVDIHRWMVQEILLKADKMSMAHSLELRVPFLDTEVFNIARTIPQKYKVDTTNTKLALRRAANKDMQDVNANRKKLAFPLPLPVWLREEAQYTRVKEYFNNEVAQKYFDIKRINKLLDIHKQGKTTYAKEIWTIYTFLIWYEEFFIKR